MTHDGESPRLLLRAALGVLVVGAGLVLTGGALAEPARSADFQRLVGGLGLGSAVDLSGDPAAFDLRLGVPGAPLSDPARLAAAWPHDASGGALGERATGR